MFNILKPKQQNRRGTVIYLTGLPATGKSSIARELAHLLKCRFDLKFKILDMDDLVSEMIHDDVKNDFSMENRKRRYWFLAKLARERSGLGFNSIISATAFRKEFRAYVSDYLPDNFVEVYLYCSKETYLERDLLRVSEGKKRIYKRQINSKSKIPGLDIVYEDPDTADLKINTDDLNIADSAKIIIEYLKKKYDIAAIPNK